MTTFSAKPQFIEDMTSQVGSAKRAVANIRGHDNDRPMMAIEELSAITAACHLLEAVRFSFLIKGTGEKESEELLAAICATGSVCDFIANGGSDYHVD